MHEQAGETLTGKGLRLEVSTERDREERQQRGEVLAHVEDLAGRLDDLLRRDDAVSREVPVVGEGVQTGADAALAAESGIRSVIPLSDRCSLKSRMASLTRWTREPGTGAPRRGRRCRRRHWSRQSSPAH